MKFSKPPTPFGLILRYLRTGYVLRTYRCPGTALRYLRANGMVLSFIANQVLR
jgi:hypothetical protein